MMVHSGAQYTDSLCQLNGWGRTTVPLHALELGLRQLQLDTVAFFLCTKENCKPVRPKLKRVYPFFFSFFIIIFIIIIYPLITRVVGAPQITSQPVSSFFSLFSAAFWDLTNSRPVHSLMLSSHLFQPGIAKTLNVQISRTPWTW